jgi:CRISPR-associated endoribonuclease Cas6
MADLLDVTPSRPIRLIRFREDVMPAVVELDLDVRREVIVYPARLHGAACRLLEPVTVAHAARDKPFAVGPMGVSDRAAGVAGVARWRLGWLGVDVPAVSASSVWFGRTRCPVLRRRVHPIDFADLAACLPARHAELELLSPTFFARNGRDYALPDPVLILGSALRRWNAHAPAEHAVTAEQRERLLGTVYVGSGLVGRTVSAAVSATMRQTGFVGTVPLALTRAASDTVARIFAMLLRFAAIAGVGAQTTHGFGATRLLRLEGPR